MKLILTENQITSLENVMSVTKAINAYSCTRNREKVTAYNTIIRINYMNGKFEAISFEEYDNSTPNANATFEKIFEILSENTINKKE